MQNPNPIVVISPENLAEIIRQAQQPLLEKIEEIERIYLNKERNLPEHINTETAAEILGVQPQTVLSYYRAGRLKSYKKDGEKAHKFLRTDVLKLKSQI